VEHHLFPQVPRHNLAAVHAEVKALCARFPMYADRL
jgi:fatty acid desaturase